MYRAERGTGMLISKSSACVDFRQIFCLLLLLVVSSVV